jgi:hypothetical protein
MVHDCLGVSVVTARADLSFKDQCCGERHDDENQNQDGSRLFLRLAIRSFSRTGLFQIHFFPPSMFPHLPHGIWRGAKEGGNAEEKKAGYDICRRHLEVVSTLVEFGKQGEDEKDGVDTDRKPTQQAEQKCRFFAKTPR